MIRKFLAVFAIAVAAAACSGEGDQPAKTDTDKPSAETADPSPPKNIGGVGRIYHYVRSNIDGTEREDVYVFRKRADFLEVYKSKEKCLNAALVTAELDLEQGYATKLVGGRLTPEGTQDPIGVMTYEPATGVLRAKFTPPGADTMEDTAIVEHEPWHLYDFDLASLTVMTQRLKPEEDFSFGLALVIPDPSREDFLLYLGKAVATFREETEHSGARARLYALGGPAFGSFGGSLWLDADEGHILDVETGIPNHLEYENFKLKLADIDDGGAPAWSKLLAAHYEDCEEG